MNDNNPKIVRGFNLTEIIIVIVATGIFTALATGIIVTSNYKTANGMSYSDLVKDTNLQQFLNSYASVLEEYYEDVDKEELINNAIEGMMNYLGDQYSVYMDSKEAASLAEDLAGEYVGIGVGILYDAINNTITINKVYNDTPAEEAGLKAGDVIVKLDGEDVSTKDVNAVTDIIKEEDKETVLTVLRGEETLEYKVKAKKILKPATETNIYDYNNQKIGYLKLEVFSSSIYEQVKKDLKNLEAENINGLIIDLRDNTGGYLEETESIAKLFLEKGKVIYSLEDKNGTTATKDNTKEKRDYKIVVLINGKSASASEVLASALKDSYGATLVGEKSFGKGKVQHAKSFDDKTLIKYTSAKWLRPNGTCIDEIGLEPDYKVTIDGTLPDIEDPNITEEQINTYNEMIANLYEEQLNKALEVITE